MPHAISAAADHGRPSGPPRKQKIPQAKAALPDKNGIPEKIRKVIEIVRAIGVSSSPFSSLFPHTISRVAKFVQSAPMKAKAPDNARGIQKNVAADFGLTGEIHFVILLNIKMILR